LENLYSAKHSATQSEVLSVQETLRLSLSRERMPGAQEAQLEAMSKSEVEVDSIQRMLSW